MNNNNNNQQLARGSTLIWFAFFVALLLRFIHLGTLSLTDSEAKWALQAMEIARGDKPLLGGQSGYLVLTAINFFIFGSSNFMARFWPALVGSGLVLVPLVFQKRLGGKTAVILAFALALDPGLLAMSRLAASPMLALGFTTMFLSAMETKRFKLAGVFAGLAMLGGPGAWFGALGLGLTWMIFRIWTRLKNPGAEKTSSNIEGPPGDNASTNAEDGITQPIPSRQSNPIKIILIWSAVTLLLAGTLFFFIPGGASAWAASLIDYLSGWSTIFLIQPWFLLIVLIMYCPLLIIFVISHLVHGQFRTDSLSKTVGFVAFLFLFLALIYPAHQPGDLVWALVPLWVLASMEMSDLIILIQNRKIEIAVTGVFTFVFLVFGWLNLIGIPNSVQNSNLAETPIINSILKFFQNIGSVMSGLLISRILVGLSAILLFILVMYLLSNIWDDQVVRLGLVWGGTIALLFYTNFAGLSAAGLRIRYSAEMWQPGAQFVQADLMEKTLDDLSEWRKGQMNSLNITVESGSITPSVIWLLRKWPITQVDALSSAASPDIIVLPEGQDVSLSSAYRSQNFVVRSTPIWIGLSFEDWLKWVAFREIPQQSDKLTLWARNDLFPDVGLGPGTTAP
jgi:hypothetical protein